MKITLWRTHTPHQHDTGWVEAGGSRFTIALLETHWMNTIVVEADGYGWIISQWRHLYGLAFMYSEWKIKETCSQTALLFMQFLWCTTHTHTHNRSNALHNVTVQVVDITQCVDEALENVYKKTCYHNSFSTTQHRLAIL